MTNRKAPSFLTPVVGWTAHHSFVKFKGKWHLFHHNSVPSRGKTWLRSLKVTELEYSVDGNGTLKDCAPGLTAFYEKYPELVHPVYKNPGE